MKRVDLLRHLAEHGCELFYVAYRWYLAHGRSAARTPENSCSNAPSNKGLERTRPAANGVTGPCRSTQCWADPEVA
jgi:hypothetical protein